jgi:hypothetical protein
MPPVQMFRGFPFADYLSTTLLVFTKDGFGFKGYAHKR